ncbi:MAG: PD-(D/E)XK nuclease family protein, partial [Phycisphaerales bacterium]|nr:PD-(D/E)XK nuclease family protein [Phycisphaerales bacterium]
PTPGPLLARATAGDAIGLVLRAIGDRPVADEPSADAIELLGWLELPLDPAPVAMLTGVNEGMLPRSTTADAMLPDSLREHLGLDSDRRRLARDAYALTLVLRSRRIVHLFTGRVAADNEPMLPSRLLFASDDDRAVARIRRFVGLDEATGAPAPVASRWQAGPVDNFSRRPITRLPEIDSLSVTAFRTYLASPYLFYLRHVLRLEEREDPGPELDAMAFGNLVHGALEGFGCSLVAASTDEQTIREFLEAHVEVRVRARHGASVRAAIDMQVRAVRQRLREFARWQAASARDGWRIKHVEWRPGAASAGDRGGAPFDVDGAPIMLRGTIDRIDVDQTGRVRIVDYKTGDKAIPPERTHTTASGAGRAGVGGAETWTDLQLPLYRHLIRELGYSGIPELGYVAISASGVDWLPAPWGQAELAAADETARRVVRAIRKGEFADVGDNPPTGGVLGALCAGRVLVRGFGLVSGGGVGRGQVSGGRGGETR